MSCQHHKDIIVGADEVHHSFLNLVLDRGQCSASRTGGFTLGKGTPIPIE